MTPVRTRQHRADSAPTSRFHDTEACGPRVLDDMTVEVALSLMAGAGVEYLVLCDDDDQDTGTVSRARLTVFRDSPAYTDRVRLRDVPAAHGRVPGLPLTG